MEKGQGRYDEALRLINDATPRIRKQVCERLLEVMSNPAQLLDEEYLHPVICHYRIVIWVLTPVFTQDSTRIPSKE